MPQVLKAGEYPEAPDPVDARHKLGDFLDRGFTAFLDLTDTDELSPHKAALHDLVQEWVINCAYRRMPIRDVDVPQEPTQMGAILDQLHTWHMQGRKAYFHCWGSVGRTGTVKCCHLIEHRH